MGKVCVCVYVPCDQLIFHKESTNGDRTYKVVHEPSSSPPPSCSRVLCVCKGIRQRRTRNWKSPMCSINVIAMQVAFSFCFFFVFFNKLKEPREKEREDNNNKENYYLKKSGNPTQKTHSEGPVQKQNTPEPLVTLFALQLHDKTLGTTAKTIVDRWKSRKLSWLSLKSWNKGETWAKRAHFYLRCCASSNRRDDKATEGRTKEKSKMKRTSEVECRPFSALFRGNSVILILCVHFSLILRRVHCVGHWTWMRRRRTTTKGKKREPTKPPIAFYALRTHTRLFGEKEDGETLYSSSSFISVLLLLLFLHTPCDRSIKTDRSPRGERERERPPRTHNTTQKRTYSDERATN